VRWEEGYINLGNKETDSGVIQKLAWYWVKLLSLMSAELAFAGSLTYFDTSLMNQFVYLLNTTKK